MVGKLLLCSFNPISPQVDEIAEVGGGTVYRCIADVSFDGHVQGSLPQECTTVWRHVREVILHREYIQN